MRMMSWFVALVAAVLFPPMARADVDSSKETDALLRRLEEGLAKWFQNVEFRSSFEVQWGDALPFKSVKEARFAKEGLNVMAQGMLHKKGKLRRSQYEYLEGWQRMDGLPAAAGINSGPTPFQYSPLDEVTDGTIRAFYISRHEEGSNPRRTFGDQLNVERLKSERDWHQLIWRDPLSFGRSSLVGLFDADPMPGMNRSRIRKRTAQLMTVGKRLVVRREIAATDSSQSDEWTFLLGAYGAVIESHKWTTFSRDRKTDHEVQFTEFRSCPGGIVPSRVVDGTRFRLPGSSENRFSLCQWVSDDLGKRSPTKDDFLITIPRTTKIMGTSKTPPLVDEKRHFDLTALSVSDLLVPRVRRRASK